MSRSLQILELLESYPLPPGIELWRMPNAAPEGYTFLGAGSVLIPKYDEYMNLTSTLYAYFQKDVSSGKTAGFLTSPVEITGDMTLEAVSAACARAVELLVAA